MIDWKTLVKAEAVQEQEQRIDRTDWRTILNRLRSPASEIAQIILVNRAEDLPRVAAFFIDPQIDETADTLRLMNEFKETQTFTVVFNRNKIEQTNLNNSKIVGEDISAIPALQAVTCLYAPPCYIVHVADSDKLIPSFQNSRLKT